jgi:hypothetical protein
MLKRGSYADYDHNIMSVSYHFFVAGKSTAKLLNRRSVRQRVTRSLRLPVDLPKSFEGCRAVLACGPVRSSTNPYAALR